MKNLKGDLLKILCENDDEPQHMSKYKQKTPNINRSSHKNGQIQTSTKQSQHFNKPKTIQNMPLKPIEFSHKSNESNETDLHKNCIDANEFKEFTEKYRQRLDEHKKMLDKLKELNSEIM